MESLQNLIGKKVKVVFIDAGVTKVVRGTLKEVGSSYLIVDNAIIGLGHNFISCLPIGGKSND